MRPIDMALMLETEYDEVRELYWEWLEKNPAEGFLETFRAGFAASKAPLSEERLAELIERVLQRRAKYLAQRHRRLRGEVE
jgi:UDP:flavonoid glycosyltransferase YjiC (YdhE family)